MIDGEHNKLRIKAYSVSPAAEIDADLATAQDLDFSTVYPGGLFSTCQFYVPRDVTSAWTLKPAHKIVVRNGLKTVWEGRVTAISIDIQAYRQGQRVTCLGYWGDVLMTRTLVKPWADTRMTNQQYRVSPSSRADDMDFDFYNRLRMTAKTVSFTTNEYAQFTYTAPTGQTVKRITFNYDFAKTGAQSWTQGIYNVTGLTTTWSVSATGTGSVDHTLATPAAALNFYLRSDAAGQTPTDQTTYAEWSSMVIYTETGSINLTEIVKDVRASVTELSTDESLIGSNTLSLVPFISEIDTYADILTRAAAYGDSSYNAWAVGLRESDLTTDNKPVLFVEQYPALTDYDYAVSIGDANFQPGFEAEQDISAVRNWIAVRHTNASGFQVVITPDDDANLKDTTSIAAYGERHEWLDIDTTSSTTAKNYARRYLAARKDPQWRVSSGLSVVGYIRGKSGSVFPASEIRAGKRVRVENFLSDLNGSGLTLLITGTNYDDNSETCRISVGQPDTLDVWLAQVVGER